MDYLPLKTASRTCRLEVRSRRLRNKGQAATVEPDHHDDTITNTKGTTDTERSRRSDRFYPVMRVVVDNTLIDKTDKRRKRRTDRLCPVIQVVQQKDQLFLQS
jgi:hypothetical protein